MRTFHMKWRGRTEESAVVCRRNVLRELGGTARLKTDGALVFTDGNVLALYGKLLKKYLPEIPVFAMEAGEEHKNGETLFALLHAMAEAGLRRNSVLIALGGGVVGDVGGLAASLYMRGIPCIQIPTTLLAQVDSSVGGKTAIDFCGVKNLVGAFHQPVNVLVDPAFLKTLPPREIRCGLGEIVKHGALDAELFDLLTAQEDLFDLKFLADIVPENIAFKASVVRRDPLETGLRRCLNLGHTTGHAVELTQKTLSHGECVLAGILYEAEIARRKLDCDGEYLHRLGALCRRVLPVLPRNIDARLARLDKKNTQAGQVTLTVPVAKGRYGILALPFAEYSSLLKEAEETC